MTPNRPEPEASHTHHVRVHLGTDQHETWLIDAPASRLDECIAAERGAYETLNPSHDPGDFDVLSVTVDGTRVR